MLAFFPWRGNGVVDCGSGSDNRANKENKMTPKADLVASVKDSIAKAFKENKTSLGHLARTLHISSAETRSLVADIGAAPAEQVVALLNSIGLTPTLIPAHQTDVLIIDDTVRATPAAGETFPSERADIRDQVLAIQHAMLPRREARGQSNAEFAMEIEVTGSDVRHINDSNRVSVPFSALAAYARGLGLAMVSVPRASPLAGCSLVAAAQPTTFTVEGTSAPLAAQSAGQGSSWTVFLTNTAMGRFYDSLSEAADPAGLGLFAGRPDFNLATLFEMMEQGEAGMQLTTADGAVHRVNTLDGLSNLVRTLNGGKNREKIASAIHCSSQTLRFLERKPAQCRLTTLMRLFDHFGVEATTFKPESQTRSRFGIRA
jgi:hypothetical protein